MATLKLKNNNKPASSRPGEERRAPVRGKGVSRPRQSLEAVQKERTERQARFDQARGSRDAARPPMRGDERGPRPDSRFDPRQGPRSDPRGGPRPDHRPGQHADQRPSQRFDQRPDQRPLQRPDQGVDQRREVRGEQRGDYRGDPQRPFNRNEQQRPYSQGRPPQAGGFQRDDRPRQDDRPRYEDRPRYNNDAPRQQQAQPPSPYPSSTPPRRDQRRATTYGNNGPIKAIPRHAPARPRHGDDDDDDDFAVHRDPAIDGVRLSKHLGVLGIASRREADEWIGAGWVRVDGKMAVLGQRVKPDAKIEIDPAAHKEQAKRVTILLNKPIGYVSGQAEDGYEPASVLVKSTTQWGEDPSGIKYHLGHARGLAPAGRLDIDSTGMLVLTQDGRIAKVLIGEESTIEKEYLVRVEYHGVGAPMSLFPAADLARLCHGMTLDDVELKPAKVSWINDDQLRFVLREGRKRQIRRMCEQVGLKVIGLKRVRIGRINLGNLPVGQWRYLSPWERFD
jgi:23S rRNA pseudouridine2604 synthase